MDDDACDTPEQDLPTNLVGLLHKVEQAGRHRETVSLGAILDSVGRRSYSPFLLVAGLVTLAPLVGDIPGVPTLMALLVALSSGQLLLGRNHIWLPAWLLGRRVSRERFAKATRWMERPARWVDHLLKHRLAWFTHPPAHIPVGLTCLLVALAMPPMELVPFSANGAGMALTLFALALLADDGLMALLGYALTFGTLTIVILNLT